MRTIATHLADRAEDAFETEASPDGMPWADPQAPRGDTGVWRDPISKRPHSGADLRHRGGLLNARNGCAFWVSAAKC